MPEVVCAITGFYVPSRRAVVRSWGVAYIGQKRFIKQQYFVVKFIANTASYLFEGVSILVTDHVPSGRAYVGYP